jgi:hypothetical protein
VTVDLAVKTPAPERAAGRKKLAKEDKALPDGSFPIPNVSYLKKALKAVGRAAAGKRPALASLIRKRARELGAWNVVKGSWADNSQTAKAMSNALRVQLLELGFTPAQTKIELAETAKAFVEFAGGAEPDTDDMPGYAKAIHKKLVAKGVKPHVAAKMATRAAAKKKKKAKTKSYSREGGSSVDLSLKTVASVSDGPRVTKIAGTTPTPAKHSSAMARYRKAIEQYPPGHPERIKAARTVASLRQRTAGFHGQHAIGVPAHMGKVGAK